MTTNYELYLICKIADRAMPFYERCGEKKHTAIMDLENWHDQMPLNLHALLGASEFEFIHDISQIRGNLNRAVGKIEKNSCFMPRFALENFFPRKTERSVMLEGESPPFDAATATGMYDRDE